MPVNLNNNTSNNGHTSQFNFDALEILDLFAEHIYPQITHLRYVEETASRLEKTFSNIALADWQSSVEGFARIPVEGHNSNYAEFAREILDSTDCADENGCVSVPVSVARWALVGFYKAQAKARNEYLQPLYWFMQGDYSAINLTSEFGRAYLYGYYAQVMGVNASPSNFEAFVTYCLAHGKDSITPTSTEHTGEDHTSD